jgi:hypothetical protein
MGRRPQSDLANGLKQTLSLFVPLRPNRLHAARQSVIEQKSNCGDALDLLAVLYSFCLQLLVVYEFGGIEAEGFGNF